MNISAKTKICMVIGDPIDHSLSPQMHNAGYKELKIDDQYVFVACNVKIENMADFITGVRAMGINGISCTIPHKIAVMQYLDQLDEIAQKIGAVNTIVNDQGILKGYNTDWLGIVKPLEKITPIKNKTVALIGAGGAARAAAYGISKSGGKLFIYNRTLDKAQELTAEFGGEAHSLEDIDEIKNIDIIINATSIGMQPNIEETPISKELITNKHVVFDLVYNPFETRLLKDAKQQGATVIPGMEMLLEQGLEQFKLYTGYEAPAEVMRSVLYDK